METLKKTPDAFKEINKCIIAPADATSGLVQSDFDKDPFGAGKENTYSEEKVDTDKNGFCRLEWHLKAQA
jgi:hypothetical protein